MAIMTVRAYAAYTLDMLNGRHDLPGGTYKGMLLTSSYTPNYDTHTRRSDLTNELSATNYTAGGNALTTVATTRTKANDWATTWATGTTYAVGDVVRPTVGNGHLYQCITAGTSDGTTEPTWPTTAKQDVTDNTCVWTEIGTSITQVTCDNLVFGSVGSPISFVSVRYLAIYRALGGASSADPLIVLGDFGSNQTFDGTLTAVPPTIGILCQFAPAP